MEAASNFKISSDKLDILIKTQGAELCSITDKKTGIEFLWQADPGIWARHAPVLFPIVGKLNENKIKINGKDYEMNQHGFARDMNFKLIESSNDSISFMLESGKETQLNYPYDFKFFIIYEVKGNALETTYKIINQENKNIYFSVGAHTGFNIPMKDLDQYKLVFAEEENLSAFLLNDGLIDGSTLNLGNSTKNLILSKNLFDKGAFIFKNLKSDYLELVQNDGKYKIGLHFEEFPYLAIWAKHPNQDFICIEPWVGLSDSKGFNGDITLKEGIIELEPHTEKSYTYTFEFSSS